MNKIEFSDINKFLSSLGLIFIGTAIFLPWFINQNTSMIFIEQEKINSSSEAGKKIIANQQNYLLFVSEHLNCIVIILIIIGLILLAFGLVGWNGLQTIRNSREHADLRAVQLQNMSIEHKKEIIEGEIENKSDDKGLIIQNYIELENQIFSKISLHYNVNYVMSQNIMLGQFSYDLIMRSKYIDKRGDLILEVKYFDKIPSVGRLRESINHFIRAINYYETTQNRRVTPIILIALKDNLHIDEVTKNDLRSHANDFRINLRIKYFNVNEIEVIDTPQLIADN